MKQNLWILYSQYTEFEDKIIINICNKILKM